MSSIICDRCGEFEEVTARTVVLPFICQLCTKDSDLAIDRDVWETEYVGPACQQAAEGVHGLYIEEEDDIPCDDATTYYIVEARGKFNKSSWFRSQNADTKGIFDDYSTALEAAECEQDGSRIEYRVVEYRPEATPCDTSYKSGVPCQSALDSVQAEQYLDPYCVGETDPRVHAMHSGEVRMKLLKVIAGILILGLAAIGLAAVVFFALLSAGAK